MSAMMKRRKLSGRQRRQVRVRKRITGTPERPRLSVFRSAKHIYAQVIDDVAGKTLAAASTQTKGLPAGESNKKADFAKQVGVALAARCKEKGVETVVFDRNGFKFHGRVKAVADGAREGGLNF